MVSFLIFCFLFRAGFLNPFLQFNCYSMYFFIQYLFVEVEASTSPTPGIPRAFDSFAVPGRREFDYQSLPGRGEFDPHAFELYPRFHVKSVGSLHVASYDGVRGVRGFSWKRLRLNCGELVTRKVLKQALCRI